ncbi:MAG TPA: fused MFS/spermidine synthase [Mycobacteriales bacterium]|nr:fused MFS/spermidine synthase [Mycobacteriales bacterium]
MTRRVELLRDLDRANGWVLLVDGVEQSYVDVADARHLEFEYMQHFAVVIDAMLVAPDPVAAVHLGGGALTMPRWLAATRPDSEQVVVEGSPEVLAATRSLPAVPDCDVVVADVLPALASLPPGGADLVVWDLYDGPRAVTSALTVEAVQAMRRLLRPPSGLLTLNVSDAAPFEVVRPVLAALRACFRDVVLLAEPATLRGRRSGNCVLAACVAGQFPGPVLLRAAAGAPTRARVVAGDELDTFIADARPATAQAPLPPPDEASGRGFL